MADFSKAFDKIPFVSILSALVKFGIPREAVLFVKHFLMNRLQRVSSADNFSDWCGISSSVPQGSVLGPVLFALVVDSLSPVCSNTLCFKYADDVSFLHFIRKESEDFLQLEWNNLEEWASNVGLFLNLDKCIVS